MSRQLPALRPVKVSRALERAGFYIHHTKGSHFYLKHPINRVFDHIAPMHSTDLRRRTLLSIVDQSGYSLEEFLELL